MNKNTSIQISKGELINTFSDIDSKINSLHLRSSSDFMKLNDYLKDYYTKTRIIYENAFNIIETISGGRGIDLVKELEEIHQKIESHRTKIRQEDQQSLRMLKDIIHKSNHLNIILKNLRQDFITLKFLSTNYNLVSKCKDTDPDQDVDFTTWIKEIYSTHRLLMSVTFSLDRFKERVTSSIRNLESKTEQSLNICQKLSRDTIKNIESVKRKSTESKLQFPLLKEKSVESSKSINDIITYLQYHDIIRQKIQHIQKSHYKIIEDLNNNNNGNGENYSKEDYSKIADIIDLQAAQLLLVSKEYQNAINVITGNFQGIAKDLTTISGISDKFSFKDEDSEMTLLKQIKDQLDQGIILLDLNNFNEINAELNSSGDALDKIISQVDGVIKPLLSKLILPGNAGKHDSDNSSGNGIYSQILSLSRDINIKHNELDTIITDISDLSGSMAFTDELESFENQLEFDRIQLMVNISKILATLDKDDEELDIVLKQNRDLNTNILEIIEDAISKGDYYEYFETTVENVIGQLNHINSRIKTDNDVDRDKAKNLNEVKPNYTVESERTIHEQVISGKVNTDNIADNIPENEIEFF
ncbi:MAG TPA: hypothetical protein VHO46_06125 [Bacteroidales bacterium]|nr:hypothetical protein [Bacteroidales bacterium]